MKDLCSIECYPMHQKSSVPRMQLKYPLLAFDPCKVNIINAIYINIMKILAHLCSDEN